MKLTVFGATGGSGKEIVRQALDAGHEVTAVVRDPARFPVTGDRLEVFRADLTDPQALRPAVAGRDAVLSGLGADELFDASPVVREFTSAFLKNKAFTNLPRKFNVAITACTTSCTHAETQDLALPRRQLHRFRW